MYSNRMDREGSSGSLSGHAWEAYVGDLKSTGKVADKILHLRLAKQLSDVKAGASRVGADRKGRLSRGERLLGETALIQ